MSHLRVIQHVGRLAIAASLALAVLPAAAQTDISELRKVIEEQKKIIQQLEERVAALESGRKADTIEEELPPVEIPAQPFERSGGGAAFMPDIAVIGNHHGTFFVPRGYEGRNRFELGEIEIALTQPLYTGMSFFATLAAGSDAGFAVGVEEAYASLSRPFKAPFDAVIGKRRLQFGRVNPLHPHAWRYVDQPAPIGAFLGEEGLFGNGASINYTLPVKGIFANLELGLWRSDTAHAHGAGDGHVHEATTRRRLALRSRGDDGDDHGDDDHHHDDHDHHGEPGAGIAGDMPAARLWLSKAIGSSAELELGGSHAFGKAENGDNIRLTGADVTLRTFPSAFSRLQLQAEAFWHNRQDREHEMGSHTRSGHYALLSYAPDKYYEYGIRYDNTRYPWPIEGREQSLSLIATQKLTEATLVRLQLKFGDRTTDIYLPARKGFKEVFLQFIWGAGSHKHPLQ